MKNIINKREDEILLEIDNKFKYIYFDEDAFKQYDKFPNQINLSLEKGNFIEKKWVENNINLNNLIYYCINFENDIKDINKISEDINEYNCKTDEINFYFEDEEEILINKIKNFGVVKIYEIGNIISIIKKNLNE